MGSDLFMNPPQPMYDDYVVDTDEEAMELLVGIMATRKEANLIPQHPDGWRVRVLKGWV